MGISNALTTVFVPGKISFRVANRRSTRTSMYSSNAAVIAEIDSLLESEFDSLITSRTLSIAAVNILRSPVRAFIFLRSAASTRRNQSPLEFGLRNEVWAS